MVAFSCQPEKGSEPGIGWNWALHAAKTQEVWVLTRSKMKKYIEPAVPEELKPRLHFCYAPSSKMLREMTIYLEYLLWQHTAYRCAKKICEEIKFDFIWHITWGNMFLPTYMYKLGIPFIWGPNGAAEQIPRCFIDSLPLTKRMVHKVKFFMGKYIMKFPWIKKPIVKAKIIIARTTATKDLLPKTIQKKTMVHLESSVTKDNFVFPDYTDDILHELGKMNYIYSGRIIDTKNTLVLVDAIEKILEVEPESKLHIIGTGDFETILRKKIEEKKLGKHIYLYGAVTRPILLKALSKCDAFLFPSLKEGASWSLLEAMYYQKPIVAFDVNGMHDTLDNKCAFLAEVNENSIIETNNNFVNCVIKLSKMNAMEMQCMGENGKDRLEKQFYPEIAEEFIAKLFV